MTPPLTPSTGSVARTRLAGDAATVVGRLRVLTREDGPAEVAAALDALTALRTDLRSLRPVLDKAWTVALRDGLDEPADALARVAALDGQARLLVECGACAPARDLLAGVAAARAALVATLPALLDPETGAALAFLASGREPAPLRAAAPVGDPGLPASVLLPPMLHRRWRKLVRETPVQDLVAVHRRAAELIVVVEVAARHDLPVIGLWPAADALRAAAAEALRVPAAHELEERLPAGPTRRRLARIVARRARSTRRVQRALDDLAALGHLLPTGDDGPPKLAGGGLVVRPGPRGPQVLLVHRVRHDDWSLPKGATAPGETVQECALREVREETGLRCRLGALVHEVVYRDRNHRAKHVRFWHMTPVGPAAPLDPAEIDEVRWLPLDAAGALLSRRRDRAAVDAFAREHGAGHGRRAA
ncbi:NUDIX hydrolase [Pseudonocardia sp. KRD-184]|uniref:NUDIX hydrolase n=1 Tax=Pseudonocardia oceani TaxID=2792013 RepID=A0ABS6UIL4_9PSEU|nr:NUDIX hydrolase [Pseudonocardia oceani]MBW0091507.1 NUDIX hydrolase [Pseudonocardia oceani]MBW0097017.1 NUDIX hydrolase [Pseudonocardia oceani]MBW0111180.1 NUDIX hydrolase [Pseudonocardia oceani]MBW0122665.1 NUDIX hydrolase [Pseudonocardia oceani]MBW0132076.1 NUDIX hydrolase [Pseudonocardia oceani]